MYPAIYLSWKRALTFIFTNLNPNHPGMLCAKFGLTMPSGSGEEDFFNVYSLSCNFLPFEKGVALYLNKIWIPITHKSLCQVWLKSSQWFMRRRWKCEKFTYGQTDIRTDNKRSEKLTWAFSSGELKIVLSCLENY